MTPVRGIRAGGALALLLLVPQLAPAAWDNVFQVTCFGRRSQSNYTACAPPCTSCAPACPCPAPCPCPQTAFVQRSLYTPVTTFQAVTSYEPVVSQRTSFFWEPVTTMSVSNFFDPCTCQCQQVATPVTSFRLRSQCNSVTNYVARVSYKPVTTMRQSCYWEQVRVPSCPPPCPTASAAAPCPTCPNSPAPVVAAPGSAPPPLNLPSDATLGENRTNPPATLGETRDQYYMPHTQSLRPGSPNAPAAPAPIPAYKPERVASRLGDASPVNGTILRNDYAPRAGVRVVFVNASRQSDRQSATADAAGRFQVNLASGQWWVYVDNGAGQMTYHNQFNHQGNAGPLTVVSR